ncbi:hypothetical protein [Aneurinibacillus aneurinilyticus]|jgi:GntR family transcriptional regulator/MocR family aminotransferase|uniref:Uncharacterized protein n=2 Tax=Aneurinibacillus aneurinilyticus TaxID=1391 RepID=A0A848CS52_ANEAE|nr:hypothetical protein [Aneurinibacillus aneurinilyticus]ERI09794.1 hypothetical protein HMPREF0083_02159 [Aneurinibacillus aneurinilyticus ATCC 12856]MCI1694974.1 hypothetical protein [Aneurinibacillus aneurinilyticus]MED0707147.1 hypothetical protein [Aneurinibacillus aneurinilyticus]MED0723465.1 hypothetical protein [Aneurinibacillus aneurinilyticus]MED0732784.1 hypothetical protein [Aneurinibacillus aneurinilyticus]
MMGSGLVRTAKKKGINVYPASPYALKPEFVVPSTVLLGFGGLSTEEIQAGIVQLKQAWSSS